MRVEFCKTGLRLWGKLEVIRTVASLMEDLLYIQLRDGQKDAFCRSSQRSQVGKVFYSSQYYGVILESKLIPVVFESQGSLKELTCLSLYSCLENRLVEPEVMLMFKDKLKASESGYQLKEGEENEWSCKCGDQPFAAYLCNQTTAVLVCITLWKRSYSICSLPAPDRRFYSPNLPNDHDLLWTSVNAGLPGEQSEGAAVLMGILKESSETDCDRPTIGPHAWQRNCVGYRTLLFKPMEMKPTRKLSQIRTGFQASDFWWALEEGSMLFADDAVDILAYGTSAPAGLEIYTGISKAHAIFDFIDDAFAEALPCNVLAAEG
ncbi:hypothetical protein llap_11869 [Limosa lapponica baueri]|uniref:Uncharacterized protein n=1 Tax=Limosa lapponica baueri TaxID=1758121 RepID=A0A2I0TVK1_LIMLA|nr:hypothetical protein llap_11869 [Limosa lapponica baueri]